MDRFGCFKPSSSPIKGGKIASYEKRLHLRRYAGYASCVSVTRQSRSKYLNELVRDELVGASLC